MKCLKYISLLFCSITFSQNNVLKHDFTKLPEGYMWVETVDLGSVKKADPTIFGEGADLITGGRGGTKYFVTNLNTSSDAVFYAANGTYEAHWRGSLQGLLEKEDGHIIPYIGGNLDLAGGNITIHGEAGADDGNNTTYHGHLAPEGGLAIINGRIQWNSVENVIVRYLTVRNRESDPDGVYDAFNLNRPQKFAVDHVSCGFSGDEAISVDAASSGVLYKDLIFQRLMINQTDQDASSNSKGALVGNGVTGGQTKANFHLSAFNSSHRTPGAGGSSSSSQFRYYNNVIYNWRGRTTVFDGKGELLDLAYNYYKHNDVNQLYTEYDLSFQMMAMPIASFDESTGDDSIFTEGNYIENLLTDLNADNTPMFTRWDHETATPLQQKNFRDTMLSIQDEVGYTPITALQAKASVIDNKEVGNNRATDEDGNTVFYHDAVDADFFTGFNAGTATRYDPDTWTHPARPTNTDHQTDDDWNGIYDGFEVQNGLGVSTETESSYTWKGVIYTNDAGYDNFGAWSAIQGGAKDILGSSLTIQSSKKKKSTPINIGY